MDLINAVHMRAFTKHSHQGQLENELINSLDIRQSDGRAVTHRPRDHEIIKNVRKHDDSLCRWLQLQSGMFSCGLSGCATASH